MREFLENASADLPTWLRELLGAVILALFIAGICALGFAAAVLVNGRGPAW